MKNQQLLQFFLFYFGLFVFFVIFYTNIHPIVPYSSDDWENLYRMRPPFPSMQCWNPTKVFPESFEPFIGAISAFFLRPIIGDYIDALVWGNALVVSFFIIVYLWSVQQILTEKFHMGFLSSDLLVLIYVFFHFVLLRNRNYSNEYLLYAHDANCYYHYVIPNLLCATIVLWLMRHDTKKKWSCRTWACLLFATYFALCSNLYSTIILTAYMGAVLFLNLSTISHNFPKESILRYFRNNIFFLSTIILWFVVQWMESRGLRANAFGYMSNDWGPALKETAVRFCKIRYNHSFVIFALIVLCGAKFFDWRILHRSLMCSYRWTLILLIATGLSVIYLILLSSKVYPYYIERGSVIFGFTFFTLLLVLMALAYLCKNIIKVKMLLLFILFFLYCWTNTNENTFKDVLDDFGPNVTECIKIDRRIIKEICAADEVGLDSVTVKVPTYTFYDNNTPMWGPTIAIAMEKHNVISREIKVVFESTYPMFGNR